MAVSDTLINTLFDGRYRVMRKLGAGGMADVYLAEDQELGRRVAIKILNDRHAADQQFVERFRREAKNAAGLSHPNIVSVYDRGESEGTYYIAMEYMDGRTLKELIVRDTLPVAVVIGYARQILAALRFAHRHGIVHRDIKPHNVLIGSEGRLKVTDFGIARAGASQMTEVGSIIGTAHYLSPEQARGAAVDQRSDIYSLGVVLYELLTGVVPFAGDTPVEIAMKHLSSVPEPPSRKRPDVPRELDKVVLRALAKDQAGRYGTAEEMDTDLARIERGLRVSQETAEAATAVLTGVGIEATAISRAPIVTSRPPAGTGYYEYEAPRRRARPFWPWLLALALVVAAGLAGWYAYTQLQQELNEAKPVAVPLLVSLPESLAVQQILNLGLRERVIRRPHDEQQVGMVYDQSPGAGEKIDRGNRVTIYVSTGKPKSIVPNLVGESLADARSALAARKLRVKEVEIFSEKPEGTVIGQSPRGGTSVVQGATVRLNVSAGTKPVPVPPVVGQSFESASAELTSEGFAVARVDVESDQPAGTVVGQDPDANALASEGSTITLSVSEGPTLTTVPDVTGLDQSTAQANLENAGFRVRIQRQETSDRGQDGVVLDQDPFGGTETTPGAPVTLVVGRFEEPAETAPIDPPVEPPPPPEDDPPPLP
ncbi:MAG: Stk1 family PASTA domain-containing Ser/Thr kinase [Actinobacteria bacterium]|nr:Stk1 family PASTA domain-containing Ser/Thr kinase [Actinomycetota bacterium]